MSQFVGHVTGLEINEGMLARAAEKTASLKNVTVMQGDITNMPLQDTHFDGICCNQVCLYIMSIIHIVPCKKNMFAYSMCNIA